MKIRLLTASKQIQIKQNLHVKVRELCPDNMNWQDN